MQGGRPHSSKRARGAAVQADGGAARRAGGNRGRPAEALADAAAAAGRRRRGQDHRGAAGGGGGDGQRVPGRRDGADRDPRRAALPDHRQGARRQAVSYGAVERPRDRGHPPRSAAGDRARRDQPRGRHAGARAGDRQVQVAGARRDRRAAPLWRGAARHAGGEGSQPRRAGDDGHADSANARPHRMRRHGGVGDPRAAAGPQADEDDRQGRLAARRGLRADARGSRQGPAGLRDLPAGRRVGKDRPEGRDGDGARN